MKIGLEKSDKGLYRLSFDQQVIELGINDLKALLMAITKTLAPGMDLGKPTKQKAQDLAARIKGLSPPGIQALIRESGPDSIVALAKGLDDDAALLDALMKNMSPNAQKIFIEDLDFKFPNGPPRPEFAAAVRDVGATLKRLILDKVIEDPK